jgi:hypothetical protein
MATPIATQPTATLIHFYKGAKLCLFSRPKAHPRRASSLKTPAQRLRLSGVRAAPCSAQPAQCPQSHRAPRLQGFLMQHALFGLLTAILAFKRPYFALDLWVRRSPHEIGLPPAVRACNRRLSAGRPNIRGWCFFLRHTLPPVLLSERGARLVSQSPGASLLSITVEKVAHSLSERPANNRRGSGPFLFRVIKSGPQLGSCCGPQVVSGG